MIFYFCQITPLTHVICFLTRVHQVYKDSQGDQEQIRHKWRVLKENKYVSIEDLQFHFLSFFVNETKSRIK